MTWIDTPDNPWIKPWNPYKREEPQVVITPPSRKVNAVTKDNYLSISVDVAGFTDKDLTVNIAYNLVTVKSIQPGLLGDTIADFVIPFDGTTYAFNKATCSVGNGVLLVRVPKRKDSEHESIKLL